MADFVDSFRLNVASYLYKGSILAASEASEFYAPKGYTLQLSRGIRAEKPFIDSQGDVIGVISSTARSKSGASYAQIQHDYVLRHVTAAPLLRSFGDGQPGDSPQARYNYGLRNAVKRNTGEKFATEYLTQGVEAKRELIVSLLARAAEES